MAGVKRFLTMGFLPERPQAGLAILRVVTGATLFLHHGLEKQPAHWAQFMAHFPNPVGIGPEASFFIAFLSDFICSLLLVIGLWTRWAALFCLVNIFVAWSLVHHFAFLAKGPGGEHGEVMVLYMAALLMLVIAGPGSASVDRLFGRGNL